MNLYKILTAITITTSLSFTSIDALCSGTFPDEPLLESSTESETTILKPNYIELEKAFPDIFGGFAALAEDSELIERSRNTCHFLKKDKDILPKLKALEKALADLNRPELSNLQSDLQNSIADNSQHTALHYKAMLYRTALALSKYNEYEEYFFRAAGFANPYGIIKSFNEDDSFWDNLDKWINKIHHDKSGTFRHAESKVFYDHENRIQKILDAGPFHSAPYFTLCTKSGEDIFGFYFLAHTYYRGIHPVPITTADDNDGELHGIHMSAWGKFCHDLAHSKVDTSNHSVTQFTNFILNAYLLQKLKPYLERLNEEEKKKLTLEQKHLISVQTLLPHVTNFALKVHNAYRQSLVDILEASLSKMGVSPDTLHLSPAFQAFAAGAFVHAHENSIFDDLSGHYNLSNLSDLLAKTVSTANDTPSGHSKQKGQEKLEENTDAQSNLEPEAVKSASTDKNNLFQTSYITGESPLTDQEIFDIVKQQPRGDYLDKKYLWDKDKPLNEFEISDYTVSRTPFYIEVKISLLDGDHYIFRGNTNFPRRLNLKHDLSIISFGEQILKEKYGYTAPQIPQEADFKDDIPSFEAAVQKCQEDIIIGGQYLLRNFYDIAMEIAEETGISKKYTLTYENALKELQQHMPEFVGNVEEFLAAAMPESNKKK